MHTLLPAFDDDCLTITHAARHVSQRYERYLSKSGVTPAQFTILRALGSGAELTMAELAHATSTDRTTLVRTLRPLLRGAWVKSRAIAERGRGFWLALTVPGRAKLDESAACWRDAQRVFERQFGARQTARLRRDLLRVVRDVART
ncbi:MarR family winged helix-turn-helix transcriptional regulator [Burkholderia alba]|uniref:MarR family winged helix-turn-helix transcriptional regulator n=1 Tax=Burkholderia alba TaxID=2683677 RepID=UPI002B05A063|nr:MarR family winged helix-turn-helix transcriptional regulator [Burkholderia alba]